TGQGGALLLVIGRPRVVDGIVEPPGQPERRPRVGGEGLDGAEDGADVVEVVVVPPGLGMAAGQLGKDGGAPRGGAPPGSGRGGRGGGVSPPGGTRSGGGRPLWGGKGGSQGGEAGGRAFWSAAIHRRFLLSPEGGSDCGTPVALKMRRPGNGPGARLSPGR